MMEEGSRAARGRGLRRAPGGFRHSALLGRAGLIRARARRGAISEERLRADSDHRIARAPRAPSRPRASLSVAAEGDGQSGKDKEAAEDAALGGSTLRPTSRRRGDVERELARLPDGARARADYRPRPRPNGVARGRPRAGGNHAGDATCTSRTTSGRRRRPSRASRRTWRASTKGSRRSSRAATSALPLSRRTPSLAGGTPRRHRGARGGIAELDAFERTSQPRLRSWTGRGSARRAAAASACRARARTPKPSARRTSRGRFSAEAHESRGARRPTRARRRDQARDGGVRVDGRQLVPGARDGALLERDERGGGRRRRDAAGGADEAAASSRRRTSRGQRRSRR